MDNDRHRLFQLAVSDGRFSWPLQGGLPLQADKGDKLRAAAISGRIPWEAVTASTNVMGWDASPTSPLPDDAKPPSKTHDGSLDSKQAKPCTASMKKVHGQTLATLSWVTSMDEIVNGEMTIHGAEISLY
jgi:hypothetical protein